MSTVIVGGGIIGLSTAYYLSLLRPKDGEDHLIHIIDNAQHLFLSASGFSGGFLAKDWFSSAVSSLGELSFRLHKELADAHDGSHNWGYASSEAYSLAIDTKGVSGKDWLTGGRSRANVAPGSEEVLNQDGTPAWITKQEGGSLEIIGSENGCAQIEPRDLGVWLLKECQRHGVKVHLNCTATKVEKDDGGKVVGLKVRKDLEIYEKKCTNIVITAGAWTPKVFKSLFPNSKTRIPIEPLAGYSIVVRSPRFSRSIGHCHSVFCGPSPNWSFAPEAISRVPSHKQPEIYVAGLNSSTMPLPEKAEYVKGQMDKEKMKELKRTTVALTGLLKEGDNLGIDDLEVVREGLCFRPVANTPIISKIDELGGLHMPEDGGMYIAAGHGPWGISLSLGTGLCMAEMILGKKTSADISGLSLY